MGTNELINPNKTGFFKSRLFSLEDTSLEKPQGGRGGGGRESNSDFSHIKLINIFGFKINPKP